MSKYSAKKCEIDGIKFDSLAEGRRYSLLKALQANGNISALACHPKFPVDIDQKWIFTYKADFSYYDEELKRKVIEDVKGIETTVFRLKKKLVEAIYGIEIKIVK